VLFRGGIIAEFVGRELLNYFSEVIVENGIKGCDNNKRG